MEWVVVLMGGRRKTDHIDLVLSVESLEIRAKCINPVQEARGGKLQRLDKTQGVFFIVFLH